MILFLWAVKDKRLNGKGGSFIGFVEGPSFNHAKFKANKLSSYYVAFGKGIPSTFKVGRKKNE